MRLPCLVSFSLLCACGGAVERNEAANGVAAANAAEASPDVAAEVGANGRSPEAAADVARRYFALAGKGRLAEAARLWADDGLATVFAAGLSGYRRLTAQIGAPGRVEGAAGSAYVDVPVRIEGRSASGERSGRNATVTLRRANDVPGSTAEQRRWRIERIDMEESATDEPRRFVGRWATDEAGCATRAWRFTLDRLTTPAGSTCRFSRVSTVPGGYDITAVCTAEGPPAGDTLKLRFAESAGALLFESETVPDAGLIRCPAED